MTTVAEIAEYLCREVGECSVVGSDAVEIAGFCSLSKPKDHCITWLKRPGGVDTSALSAHVGMAVISPSEVKGLPGSFAQIVVSEPKRAFFSALDEFFARNAREGGVSPSATVLTDDISEGVSIGPNSFIGEDVSIGPNTRIGSNVSIVCPCTIGAGCILWPGVVIGTDGFGYWADGEGASHKVPHYGGVRIGDGVEIGANTCIDRGTLDDTVIGNGAKIDNMVHIAHNCQVGENVLITAQSGLGGSVTVGEGAYIAPNAIVVNQSNVGAGAYIGIGSVVIRNVPNDMKVFGHPARKLNL